MIIISDRFSAVLVQLSVTPEPVCLCHHPIKLRSGSVAAASEKVLGWHRIYKLAYAFLWEYSYKRLQLAHFLDQLDLTW